MAQLILSNGTCKKVNPQNGTKFSYQELYEYLDCRIIEFIALGDGRMMVCDEEAKCFDGWEETKNTMATDLYKVGREGSRERAKAYYEEMGYEIIDLIDEVDPSDCIAGSVVICWPQEV